MSQWECNNNIKTNCNRRDYNNVNYTDLAPVDSC